MDPVELLIHINYDNKLTAMTNKYIEDLTKLRIYNISQEIVDFFSKAHLDNIQSINLERQKAINLSRNYKQQQKELEEFISVGEKMLNLKHSDRYLYDYLVSRSFSFDSPISIFKSNYGVTKF